MAADLYVTGAGGFLGRALAAHLESASRWSVVRQLHGGDAGFDVTDQAALKHALLRVRPSVIVHAAGRTTGDAYALARDNILSTVSVIQAAAAAVPHAQVIVLGSAAEYGQPQEDRPVDEDDPCRPVTAYGAVKYAATQIALTLARETRLRVLVLRLFNVVGEDMPATQVLGSFLAKAIAAQRLPPADRTVTMGPLGAERDFITTTDLGNLVAAAVERGAHGRVLNACSGKGRRVGDLVEVLREAFDPAIRVESAEAGIAGGFPRFVGSTRASMETLGVTAGDDLVAVLKNAAQRTRAGARAPAANSR